MKKDTITLIIFLFMPSTAIAKENQDQNNIDGELVDEILEQVDTYELENMIGQMNIETVTFLT